jgi:Tol biopolymer transport system component/predicted Ser/Thr protein kinase
MERDRQSQIEDLLHSALALEPAERASFLKEACSDNEMREEVTRTLVRISRNADNQFVAEPQYEQLITASPNIAAPDSRIGQMFGAYRILRRIGAGGMGEVYLAMDTRLERQVALKFLPAQTSADEIIVRRFQQEARTASSLNHPNILTIFDVGKINGEHFIASEFVEGATLRSRLRQGPLEYSDALDVVSQIASALVAAHSAGVIHRDLKPTNIMIRPDGYVKVIDFGLAKMTRLADGNPSQEAHTRPGTMVGTVDYMSPEQARGEEVDPRTDLWSVGVLFYEMLSGARPFTGRTDHHVIVEIFEKDPPQLGEPGLVPPEIVRVLERCLQKDRDQRYATASELQADIREARRALNLSTGSLRSAVVVAPKKRGVPFLIAWASLAATLAGLLVWWYALHGRDVMLGPERFEIADQRPITFNGRTQIAAISPDGKYLAYIAGNERQQAIWIKRVGSTTESTLVPPNGDRYQGLTFSKDSQDVYAVSRHGEYGRLFRIPVVGGGPQLVRGDVDGPAVFAPNRRDYAFVRYDPARKRARNESALLIATLGSERKERSILNVSSEGMLGSRPAWSDRDSIAAFIYKNQPNHPSSLNLLLLTPVGKIVRTFAIKGWRGVYQAAWMPNGRDIIVPAATYDETDDQMQLREFSTTTGKTINITKDVYGYKSASLTDDGKELLTVKTDRRTHLWLADQNNLRTGKSLPGDAGRFETVTWADDGRLISQANRGTGLNLWVLDLAEERPHQLTEGEHSDRAPAWVHGQKAVVFISNRSGNWNLWRLNLDSNEYTPLTNSADYLESPTCSPDGQWILYTDWNSNRPTVMRIPSKGGKPQPAIQQEARNATFSPDETRIAAEVFHEDPGGAGTWEVALFSFDTGAQVLRLPQIPPGSTLRWSPDGNGLDYIVTDRNGVSNLWHQGLDGASPNQITNFEEEQIFDYSWSADGRHLACLRGRTWSDAVLLIRK